MKRIVLSVVALAALVLPATAAAKGPSEATISGPGLASPLEIRGDGEGGWSTDLGILVEQGGFFPQTFGQSPSPLLRSRPSGLGRKYSVVYVVPPGADTLRQDLYPYARGGPVTYMAPGQRLWDQRTAGGWYRGTTQLKSMLVRAGLPRTSPEPARSSGRTRGVAVGTGAGILLAAGALVFLQRRR
jgi:hypothetical protein